MSSLAMALLGVALVSDLLDGLIARKMDQITELGQILDPVADKSLFLSLFGFFTWVGDIPAIAFFLLLVPYSALLIGGGVLYSAEGEVISSNVWGKSSSSLLTLGLISVFFGLPYALYLIYVGIAASYVSAIVYFTMGADRRSSKARESQ
jgi:cardiolipin synthase